MMEVLIAVVVLALGVIGAAGLQLTALRSAQQATMQAQAIQLATEMADKMRADVSQMRLAASNNPFLNVDFKNSTTLSAPATLCYAANCTEAQLAAFEIFEWESRIRDLLPDGRAKICRDNTPYPNRSLDWSCDGAGPVVIKIGWQGKGINGELERYSTEANEAMAPKIALLVKADL
jgi:type IV pilus assembly protein PilV